MLWLLEPDVFGPGPHPLTGAAKAAGHRVVAWDDDWWLSERFPSADEPALFHGSLGNAAKVAALGRWTPGAYCDSAAFRCSAWYPRAAPWLVHTRYESTTVASLVAEPEAVAGHLADAEGKVFVRPDSPLKPFSGRVVTLAGLRAADLDHGFYYDELELPILVTPTQRLGHEWRFVIAEREIVSGCRYIADGRKSAGLDVSPEARALAESIAATLEPPQPVYVLDLVESEAGPKLVELNPFSGADLYDCERARIVDALAALVDST